MIIKPEEIYSWNHKYRLKFINSLSGYKGVHLIGSKGKNGITNLAVFNSIVHISSEPARIGFIVRPLSVPRHTYNNIVETEYFTINHVHKSFVEQAHFTSLKLENTESEFDLCNLEEQYISNFHAPFVTESNVKIGLKLIEDIEIKESGCRLIIGEVLLVDTKEEFLEEDGQLDLEKSFDVCVTGLNQYSSVKKMINIPYARKADVPNFGQKKRPDNVVFDEESQNYNAHLLPYGSNIGSPSIKSNNLSAWKTMGINSFNHILKNQIEGIKDEYDTLVKTYHINESLYNAKYEFEPIIGETYHLYVRDNSNENFLSMIPPNTWKRKHLGSFKLNSNKVWEEIKD
ncbi:MAG: flavin reductase (DIM6/NTAB) family NADH-FMN oxidoreductase RutF [Gammaproteobacteria bacterium]